jgi:hypothetical protein
MILLARNANSGLEVLIRVGVPFHLQVPLEQQK